jgi:D-3-phosphoglycerate dehydrogenase
MDALTHDLLTWIAKEPRTYRDTMEAWRTHCPRLPVWEDAIDDGLVRVRDSKVTLTRRGEAMLEQMPEAALPPPLRP